MSFKNLKEFIEIAKEAGACELEYEDGEKKFSVAFPTAGSATTYVPPVHNVHAPHPHLPAASSTAPAEDVNDGLLKVTSPFVGTFYRSSSPGSDPYAKVGDRVSSGQVLCIVEAMKIMNEIESEVSGEIVEICVENETYVEFGQTLFKVKP